VRRSMLKIIGGKHRGRALEEPQGKAVRPTASRAREALFNIVAHANWHEDGTSPLVGARVLDAFAGSGALGLEALSRGAEHARRAKENLWCGAGATRYVAPSPHPPSPAPESSARRLTNAR